MFVSLDTDEAHWLGFGDLKSSAWHTHAQCYCNILQDEKNHVRFKDKHRVQAKVNMQLNNNTQRTPNAQNILFYGLFFRQICTL